MSENEEKTIVESGDEGSSDVESTDSPKKTEKEESTEVDNMKFDYTTPAKDSSVVGSKSGKKSEVKGSPVTPRNKLMKSLFKTPRSPKASQMDYSVLTSSTVFGGKTKEFSKMLKKKLDTVNKMHKNENWKVVSVDDDGCAYSTLKLADSKMKAIKASMTIRSNASGPEFIDFIDNMTRDPTKENLLHETDETCVYYKPIKLDITKNVSLYHSRFTANVYFITDRDFIILRKKRYLNKGQKGLIYGCSYDVEDKEKDIFPRDGGCTRGKITLFYWFAKKVKSKESDDEHLYLEYYSHTDPCGFIPSQIYNKSLQKKAGQLKKIANAFTRQQKMNNVINDGKKPGELESPLKGKSHEEILLYRNEKLTAQVKQGREKIKEILDENSRLKNQLASESGGSKKLLRSVLKTAVGLGVVAAASYGISLLYRRLSDSAEDATATE